MQTKKFILTALAIPIMALAGLTAYRQFILSSGEEVVLPISAYDPRDLLSGYYLVYQVDYGIDKLCTADTTQNTIQKKPAYVCLQPKLFSYTTPQACSRFIQGTCNGRRFEAGIERYYVSQQEAQHLEKLILSNSKKASIALSITRSGQAQVKDLLIDGQSWKTLR